MSSAIPDAPPATQTPADAGYAAQMNHDNSAPRPAAQGKAWGGRGENAPRAGRQGASRPFSIKTVSKAYSTCGSGSARFLSFP